MGSRDAQAVTPPLAALGAANLPKAVPPRRRLWSFSADDAEHGIQMVSRLAGPVILLLALSAIAFFIIKALI
jgi:hypothetical protein